MIRAFLYSGFCRVFLRSPPTTRAACIAPAEMEPPELGLTDLREATRLALVHHLVLPKAHAPGPAMVSDVGFTTWVPRPQ